MSNTNKIQIGAISIAILVVLLCCIDKPTPIYPSIEPAAITPFTIPNLIDVAEEFRDGLCIAYDAKFTTLERSNKVLYLNCELGELSSAWRFWKVDLVNTRKFTKPKFSRIYYRNSPYKTDHIEEVLEHSFDTEYTQYVMIYIVPTRQLTNKEKESSINSIKARRGPILHDRSN